MATHYYVKSHGQYWMRGKKLWFGIKELAQPFDRETAEMLARDYGLQIETEESDD